MKLLKSILSFILIASMLLSLASCKADKNNDSDTDTGVTDNSGNKDDNKNDTNNDNNDNEEDNVKDNKAEYTVTVVNPFGKPISDVTVFVHLDGAKDYNVCTAPITTGEDGKATFTLNAKSSYSVGVAGYPSVYSAKKGDTPANRYAFDGNNLTVTLDVNSSYSPKSYKLGDYIANFTLTDIDGNTYELYDVLKEKKAVALNYWFYNCPWCVREFPALNESYNTNKDDIAVFAINDCDPLATVKRFEGDKNLTLDMPIFQISYGSAASLYLYGITGYPTTVIIDRYGMISFVHSNAITVSSDWDELFAYFTSDEYDGKAITKLEEIK